METESSPGLESLARIDTPGVVIESAKLLANLDQVRQIAKRRGVSLRPHIKTHKSFDIGRLQLEAGAIGITASKSEEAAAFMQHGFGSVTLAYPMIEPGKISRLLAVSRECKTDLRLTVDSRQGLAAISEAISQPPARVGIFLKIDVGLHRCGLAPEDPQLPELAGAAYGHPALDFRGILSHAGHAYGAADRREVREIARRECELMRQVRQHLEAQGVRVPEVSVGATPTVLASDSYEGITEIRPGNYVFMDRTPIRLGLVEPARVALTVIATVISRNDRYAIVDAGSKVLSSDAGAHGSQGAPGFGAVYPLARFPEDSTATIVEKLSEEHGFVSQGPIPYAIGDRVRIIPNHSCAVANLTDSYQLLTETGTIRTWPVHARGLVH